jgi:MSHA biogenesis protein MshQ
MIKLKTLAVSCALIASTHASATLLSGGLNVDNGYAAYISTDNTVQGNLISSANNWYSTYHFSGVNLTAGQNYFLHIFAYDQGGIAGFLGEFNLTGSDHQFSNGLTNLKTNTTDWDVSLTGWNNYQDASYLGNNGVWPWGSHSAISGDAEWIWTADAHNHNQVYFTTAITATQVSEPGAIMLLGFGLAGLMIARRKSK